MNKSAIKDRMLAFCANTIGYKSVDLIDPILRLFIEALSEEIYQVQGEIDALQDRIINTLSMYLVPDTSLFASPAHSIVRLDTLSEFGLDVEKDSVFTGLNDRDKEEFYPLGNTHVLNAEVSYIEVNKKLLQYSNYSKRFDLVAKQDLFNTSSENSIWIGVDIKENEKFVINDLLFFIDILNIKNKKQVLDILFYAPWTHNSKRLVLKRGGRFIKQQNTNEIELLQGFEPFYNIHKNIEEYYTDHFIELKDFSKMDLVKQSYPDCFESQYSIQFLDQLKHKKLVWIKIDLPKDFETEILQNINVSLNCVPILNKTRKTLSIEPNEVTKIIKLPIDKESYFLAIDSIKDSSGKAYFDVQYKNTPAQEYGTYTLRKGGYEKYSSNDAKDYLEGLGEFLLVESHRMASGAASDENIRKVYEVLQDLTQYIQSMTLTTKQRMEHQVYIVLDQYVKDEIYYIDYWTTSGERANKIDNSTILTTGYNNVLEFSSITLQTDFVLGSSEPNSVEKRQQQKSILNQNHIIVNDLDIYNFCQSKFKHTIEKVKVIRNVEYTQEEGFIKTIEVHLTPNKNISNFLTQKNISWFKNQLEKISPEHFQYRIFLAS